MPVVVTINLPADGALLQLGANYQLVGTIQTSSPDGPTPIEDISAQGPGLGPVQLTAQGNGRFRFTAQGRPSAAGIFPISVRAVDDRGVRGSRRITVSVGFMYSPVAPDILVDIEPGDVMSALFDTLISPKLQSAVMPLSQLLPAPLMLVGPEHLLRGTTERIGFWMLEPGRINLTPPLFTILAENPPASQLPSLPSNAVVASFRLLPNSTVTAPPGSSPLGPFGFDISVSTGALQKLADALLSKVRAAVAQEGATVESISVTCTPPNMVVTVVRGNWNNVGFTLTMTEVLGTVAGAGSPAGQIVPSITGTARIDVRLPGWGVLLSGIAGVLGFATLFAATGVLTGEAETNANNALSVANASISGIPQVISFKTGPIPVPLLGPLLFGGLFPAAIPSWTSLGVTAAGIVGTGTLDVRTRTVSDIALTLSGPTTLIQTEPGAVQAAYTVSWRGIIPDPSTFVLTVSGRFGVVFETVVIPITNAGRSLLVISFPIPEAPSAFVAFSLAVSATETSEGDGVTTLVAPPARLRVVVRRARLGRGIDP